MRLLWEIPTRIVRWTISGLWFLFLFLLPAWATLAIYYSNLPWWSARLGLAAAFAVFAVWVFLRSRQPKTYAAFALLYIRVIVWWVPPHA